MRATSAARRCAAPGEAGRGRCGHPCYASRATLTQWTSWPTDSRRPRGARRPARRGRAPANRGRSAGPTAPSPSPTGDPRRSSPTSPRCCPTGSARSSVVLAGAAGAGAVRAGRRRTRADRPDRARPELPAGELFDRIDAGLAASGVGWPSSAGRAGSARAPLALGEMTVEGLVERFVVGHVEEHVGQLEEMLARRRGHRGRRDRLIVGASPGTPGSRPVAERSTRTTEPGVPVLDGPFRFAALSGYCPPPERYRSQHRGPGPRRDT